VVEHSSPSQIMGASAAFSPLGTQVFSQFRHGPPAPRTLQDSTRKIL
jgi:hypothetical protein